MLSGFNTNFRYRGVLFHVQTEDSGVENPHVITHLFYGGNIMASEKRDYSELLRSKDQAGLEDAVRKLMEGLHKSMLKQLSRGEHDSAIAQRLGAEIFGDATAGETLSGGLPSASSSETTPAEPLGPSTAMGTGISTEPSSLGARPAPTSVPSPPTPAMPPAESPAPTPPAASSEIAAPSPPLVSSEAVSSPPAVSSEASSSPPSVFSEAPSSPPSAADDAGGEQAEPRVSQLSSVFGERVVSERPLDEVVLDYLVENARKRKRPSK